MRTPPGRFKIISKGRGAAVMIFPHKIPFVLKKGYPKHCLDNFHLIALTHGSQLVHSLAREFGRRRHYVRDGQVLDWRGRVDNGGDSAHVGRRKWLRLRELAVCSFEREQGDN